MKKNPARYFLMIVVAVLFVLVSMSVYAAENGKIVEFTLKESQLTVFVKKADETVAASAALGKIACDDVYYQTISDAGIKMYTLILIDNSLSIPKDSRAASQTELLEWVAARKENEAFAVGTISDQVSIIRDFTSDYIQLKETIETIEYKDQETYLTDALYDYLARNPFQSDDADIFYRILLISDGVDNKALGYTKDELQSLLKETPIPIYTIGVGGEIPDNNEALENMFALARVTGGEAFLLEDLNSTTTSLVSIMEADWSNLTITVGIPESAQDGSLQTLTIVLQSQNGESTAVSLDGIRMPLATADIVQDDEPIENIPVHEEKPEDKPLVTDPMENLPEEKENPYLLFIGGAVAAVILVVILMAVLIGRRKKATHQETTIPQSTAREGAEQDSRENAIQQQGDREFEVTERLEEDSASDETSRLWGQDEICRITLTDIHSPEKFYQITTEASLIIGASNESDICINYDRTVSRKHCEIIREGKELFLINHSQSNGTLLDGIRVVSKTPLTSGSIIKMGRVEMRIEIDG